MGVTITIKDNSITSEQNLYCMLRQQVPPPRQPRGRVLASSAGGTGFNPQSRTASYQRHYKNGTRQFPCTALNIEMGNSGSFSRIKILINVIDKFWDRQSFEVRSFAVVAGMKKRITTQNRQKSNAKKKTTSISTFFVFSTIQQLYS